MDDEISLCLLCAKRGKTCCQDSEIYVSLGDVDRIAAYVGHRYFYHHTLPQDMTRLDDYSDPVWNDNVFRADGRWRALRKGGSDNDCYFLNMAGCTLPIEVRPLVCRLYPYDYDASGLKAVQDMSGQYCPLDAVPVGKSLFDALGMVALGMMGEEIKTWHSMLYAEIAEDRDGHEGRSDV